MKLQTSCLAIGLPRVGNVAERGPLATVGGLSPTLRKRFRNESVSGCGFLYIKTRNHRKTTTQKLPKNAKKQQLTEKQKVTENRNINKIWAQFLLTFLNTRDIYSSCATRTQLIKLIVT